jgi:hypothetical protein
MRTTLCVLAAVLLVGASTSDAAQRRDERRSDVRDTRDRGDERWDTRDDDRRDDRYDHRGERSQRDDRYDGRHDDRVDHRGDVRGNIHIVFSSGDARIVREYYAPRYRRLPPGLRKKYARTGQLPPGWQRRVEPLPWDVERRMMVLPREYRRGVVDNQAIIYAPRTGIVIDATVIF